MQTLRRIPSFLLLAAAAAAQVPAPDWAPATSPTSPSPRGFAAFAFDAARGRTVLFGGTDTPNYLGALGGTWTYDGVTWQQAATAQDPGARWAAACCYDPVRQVVVLFGGGVVNNQNSLADTWEWNGANWTRIVTPTNPGARTCSVMWFDAAAGKVVMFGGIRMGYGGSDLADTWTYDGVDWQPVATAIAPTSRYGMAAAYDPTRSRAVMYGGFGGGQSLGDTWEFDGANWTQAAPANTPPPLHYAAMVWSPTAGKCLLFGGRASTATISLRSDQTWTYDGANWVQQAPVTAPPARSNHALAFDAVRGQAVVFGGYGANGYLDATWEYGANPPAAVASSATMYGVGCGSPAMAFAPINNPVLGTLGQALITHAPTTVAGVAMGVSNTFSFPIPLPFELSSLGMPGCYLLQSAEIVGLGAAPATAATLRFQFLIPANSALAGQTFYLQSFALAPGYNPTQVVLSNGIAWRLGTS